MLFNVEIIARDFPIFAQQDKDFTGDARSFTPELMDRLSTEGRYLIGNIAPAAAGASVNRDIASGMYTVRHTRSSHLISLAGPDAVQHDVVLNLTVESENKFEAGVAAIKATTSPGNHSQMIDLYRFRTVWSRAFPLSHTVMSSIHARLVTEGMDARLTPPERLDRCRLTVYRNSVAEGAMELSMECELMHNEQLNVDEFVTYPIFNILYSDGSHIGSLFPTAPTRIWEGDGDLSTGDLDVFNADNLHRVFAATLVPFNMDAPEADNKPS